MLSDEERSFDFAQDDGKNETPIGRLAIPGYCAVQRKFEASSMLPVPL
jgi:hypothetical protein